MCHFDARFAEAVLPALDVKVVAGCCARIVVINQIWVELILSTTTEDLFRQI